MLLLRKLFVLDKVLYPKQLYAGAKFIPSANEIVFNMYEHFNICSNEIQLYIFEKAKVVECKF